MDRRDGAERLRDARLYAIFDLGTMPLLPMAIAGGADVVQLRDKHASDEELVDAGKAIADACREGGVLFVMNDRPDLALECGADGVHVGQEDASVESVRAMAGDRLLVGVSTHSPAQADAAEASDADYFAVGPVHETPTKQGRPAVGLELVRHAAASASKPWFAIGGINPANARAVVDAGAERLAVVRALQVEDPVAAARTLRAVAEGGARVG
jgi:thiamine-phosphate pyrophosphorylase